MTITPHPQDASQPVGTRYSFLSAAKLATFHRSRRVRDFLHLEHEAMTDNNTQASEPTDEGPAAKYARLQRWADRKGYTLNQTVTGYVLKRGTVSKHFGRVETGFQLLRQD